MLSVVVPSYNRAESLARLLSSIEAHAPSNTEVILVIQDGTAAPAWVYALYTEPSYPALARRRGALHARGDYLLFLDDDHSLRPEFAAHWHALATLADAPALVSLPTRRNRHPHPRIIAMCGGMLIRRDAYFRAGGHGEDYLDDVELCLRCRWAGIAIVRYHTPITTHHYGTAGGLRSLSTVHPKRTAHLRLSRLDERYPDRIVRDSRSWWGFKEIQHGR